MFKFSSKGLSKRALDDFEDGSMANSHGRRVLDERVNLTSTNRGIRTVNQMVVANEQTKKGLGYFHSKRKVQDDGTHTKPLN